MPLPEGGVTDTGATTIAAPGTVQLPIMTQPLWPLMPSTCIFMFFVPTETGRGKRYRQVTTLSVLLPVFTLLPLPH